MPTVKLTDRGIRAAKGTGIQTDFRDTVQPGLVLRVFESGRKVWGILYRTADGRRRWFKLGLYPGVSLEKAREVAKIQLGKVAAGEDPQALRESTRRRSKVETVADLARDYLEHYAKKHKRPRSIAEDEKQLERYVLPAWGRQKITEVTRRDVRRLLERVGDGTAATKGRPTTSAPRQLRALLSKMFSWAVDQDYLQGNPAAGIRLPKPGSRDRVLTEDELRRLLCELSVLADVGFTAAGDEQEPLQVGLVSAAAFRMLLLTGQRPGEVLGMRWSEVAGDWWTIPRERMKGKKSHRVPLSAQAMAVLDSVRPITGSSAFVFESLVKPGAPLSTLKTANHGLRVRMARGVLRDSGLSAGELAQRAEVEPGAVESFLEGARSLPVEVAESLAGVSRWTPHDLRRTAATLMTSGGIPRLVVERILGHAEHGVASTYDRSSYDPEKRKALAWWGREVERIASGEHRAKVVNIAEHRPA